MATESTSATSVVLQLIGYEVPVDFGGCRCQRSECDTNYCACFKGTYRCTVKCHCLECENVYGTRGGSSTEQKKGIPRPPTYVLIGVKVPDGFMGCQCQSTECKSGKCPCFRRTYSCTSRCRCRGCFNPFRSSSTEPRQGGTGDASNTHDETTAPITIEPEQTDEQPPQVEEQSREIRDFDLNQLPSPNTGDSSTETGQGGTGGASNAEEADDTSGMAMEPPQVEEQSRDNKDLDLNQLPSPNTGDSITEPGQGATAGTSNVPDDIAPPANIKPEQGDDTSGMVREAPQVEEQTRNKDFDLNKLP